MMVPCMSRGGQRHEVGTVTSKLRVLLVEDSDMYRQGLRAFLESVGEIDVGGDVKTIEVVKEATNRTQAVQSATTLRPDLVVMDLRLPDLGGVVKAQEGLSAIQQITTADPAVKVLVVTMKREERWARKAMDAGAKGYGSPGRLRPTIVVASGRHRHRARHALGTGPTMLRPAGGSPRAATWFVPLEDAPGVIP